MIALIENVCENVFKVYYTPSTGKSKQKKHAGFPALEIRTEKAYANR